MLSLEVEPEYFSNQNCCLKARAYFKLFLKQASQASSPGRTQNLAWAFEPEPTHRSTSFSGTLGKFFIIMAAFPDKDKLFNFFIAYLT